MELVVLTFLLAGIKMSKIRYILFLLLFACTSTKLSFEDQLNQKFEKGVELFDKQKYSRAKDELEFIITNNPGSKMALTSQYLLGESYYMLKEFESAAFEFDKFARFSQEYDKVESARFRICQCAVNMSNSFQKDQKSTLDAISRLQEFIEDYPNSKNFHRANQEISSLRYKLARKEFQSARLYLKLEEYDSALIYFNNILSEYYDTEIIDDVRISIIFLYLLQNKTDIAVSYLEEQKLKFVSGKKLSEAENLIIKMKNGIGVSEYIRLYK